MKTCSRVLVNSGLDVSTYETTVLEDIFPFLFSISQKKEMDRKKIQGQISWPLNPFLNFVFNCKSEVHISKFKSTPWM